MKDISSAVGLSYTYTNHYVWGTTASAMTRTGYTKVLRVWNIILTNLPFQIKKVSENLFKYTSNSDCSEDDDDDFKEPPNPLKTPTKKPATVSKNPEPENYPNN